MLEIKKIILKVLALILDIILLGHKVIKQVTLPNRKRKGNLLSSLFIFFIDIIERLNSFEHGIFSMTALFRKKYVKQTIFIIGFILFLLSLFEWTAERFSNNIASTNTVQLLVSAEKKTLIAKQEQAVSVSDKAGVYYQLPACSVTYYTSPAYSAYPKKFLLNCSLRI